MSSAVIHVARPSDLDELWSRSSEPDLELDQSGRIQQVRSESEERRSAMSAAAPVALGAVVSSISRWD